MKSSEVLSWSHSIELSAYCLNYHLSYVSHHLHHRESPHFINSKIKHLNGSPECVGFSRSKTFEIYKCRLLKKITQKAKKFQRYLKFGLLHGRMDVRSSPPLALHSFTAGGLVPAVNHFIEKSCAVSWVRYPEKCDSNYHRSVVAVFRGLVQ